MAPKDQPTPPPADDQTDDPTTGDVAGYVEPADDDELGSDDTTAGGYVRYEVDGVSGHGLVLEVIEATDDRDAAVVVIPLADTVTVPADAIRKD